LKIEPKLADFCKKIRIGFLEATDVYSIKSSFYIWKLRAVLHGGGACI
jgi:hypothetical protein